MGARLTGAYRLLTCTTVSLITSKRIGSEPEFIAFGKGNIKDMVLHAIALKKQYNNFVKAIDEAAIESGELHALREFKEALGALDK